MKIITSGIADEKAILQGTAKKFFFEGAEVVVFGHTHQPDECKLNGKRYFNPGSWTRYVKLEDLNSLTLKDLENDEDFPYQLNFIRIAALKSGNLVSEKICYEQKDGQKFHN